MTHQVALANDTYDRLKREKQAGESFSQVIERLLKGQAKDPMNFVRTSRRISKAEADRRIREIEDLRNMDRL